MAYWFVETIEELKSKAATEKLSEEEENELIYALDVLEVNVTQYGFDEKTGEFPD